MFGMKAMDHKIFEAAIKYQISQGKVQTQRKCIVGRLHLAFARRTMYTFNPTLDANAGQDDS